MGQRNHCSSLKGIPKMKLQGSGPSTPKSLQSQNRPRPENRLSISRLDVVHGQLSTHEATDFYMIEAKPENLVGDRAYDSDPLDEELRKEGIEMIAPHRSNRSKPPTQDRRRLSRYMRRWLVERFFAWIQWQRRILVRWEYYAQNFLGFVQLACLVVLFKRF